MIRSHGLAVPVAVLLAAMSLSPAAASEAATCVQTSLAKASYPIGAVDGVIGRKTVAAARSLASTYGRGFGRLPDLTDATADAWCALLQSEDAIRLIDSRKVPEITAPDAVGARGGLRFGHRLVRENIVGMKPAHYFHASLWPGRVAVETDPDRIHSGKASIRFHILPGDCSSTINPPGDWDDCPWGNERIDLGFENHRGTRYYAVSIFVGENATVLESTNTWHISGADINLFQWFQRNLGPCFDIQYNTRENVLNVDNRCHTGEYDHHAALRTNLEGPVTGVWHEFVAHAKWSRGKDGYFKLLHNGELVVDYSGPTLARGGESSVAVQAFIYRYGSKDRPAWMGYKTGMTVWLDDIMRANSANEIAKWYNFDAALLK